MLSAILIAVAVTTVLAYVLYRGARDRAATNASVNLQVAQASRYEDAQTAFGTTYADLTMYYLLRQAPYAAEFRLAQEQVDQSLDAARNAAPALGDAEVKRADALVNEYAIVGGYQRSVIAAIEQGDLDTAVMITGATGLQTASPEFLQHVRESVDSARQGVATTQRNDAASQRRTVAYALTIAGAWAVLLLILGFTSFRWLVGSLERVRVATRAIARGDLTAKVPEDGPLEIAQVAADVNRMTESLIRNAAEYSTNLERDLAARTRELEGATKVHEAREARFRVMVQNATDMVTVVDERGFSSYASPSVERLLGYTADQWSALSIFSLVHPDDRTLAAEAMSDVVSFAGAHLPSEFRVMHADGKYRYLEVAGTNLLDDAAVRGIVLNARDVSGRHEIEAKLRDSEERFRSLADHSPVGVYQLAPNRRVLYMNAVALAFFEIDDIAMAHRMPFDRFFTPASLETMRVEHAKRTDGIASSYEVEVIGLRGKRTSLLVSGGPVWNENGEVQYLHGTMTDITERKRAEDALKVNEEKFRLLFASNPHPMWVYDRESLKFLEVNDAAISDYGYTRPEFLNMRITDIRPEEDVERLLAAVERTAPLKQSGHWRHCRKGGGIIDVEITSHSFEFESRDAILVVALDITERMRVTRALAESEERFRSLVQNATDLITVIRADTTVVYQSPSSESILGYQPSDLIGRKLSEIMHGEDAHRLLAFLSHATSKPEIAAGFEARLLHHDGTWRTFEIVGSDHTADPAVGGFVLNTRDVTDRKLLEHQLRDQAFQDALTGLANRARFVDRLEHALERSERGSNSVAVLFIDLDNFKSVNDSLGHTAGDSVLVQVGQRVEGCVRAGDTVARFGGDEFAVLIEDMGTTDEALHMARRVVGELAKPFSLTGGSPVIIGASVGVAFANEQEGTRDLVDDADVAMYIAKTHGKGRYEIYNPNMHEAMARRLELVADLQRALEKSELFVEYQPTFRLTTGEMTGVEALVRWQHPRIGRIMPGDFIDLAEESGLILALGHWVLTAACRQARQWQLRNGNDFGSMSVNISVRQLQQPSFVEEVADVIDETGVDPSRLILELTESVMTQDVDETILVLSGLKALGVRLAIDDFGTGYSSLSYLSRYPFDILKIDKSFIDGIDGPGNQLELTRAIIELARVLNLEIVAEGIEREAQAILLRELNCDDVQGFLFSRPLSADAVVELVARARIDLAA